jgi:hypothetical protein
MTARINAHHICYDPAWIVDIQYTQHKVITALQRTKATSEKYSDLTNFVHALMFEWNRMRMELDTGLDLRIPQNKPKE